ncbi:MAG TPA: glycosyltransferase family 4 protein [Thermoanaerobacterales bacterium]|jgi:glycosyltransferase involved in cell wall biosynthesis|nr:glycosyltransferase family 4 protein [Thermoanaerobacterales bacterium]
MIKVLHVLTDTNIGGAGRYLFNLLSRVDYSCFEVVVACPGGGELEKQLKSKGIRVFTLEGGESSANFGHIKKLRQIISREKADIVHTHASFAGRIAGKLSGCKVVMTRHGLGSGGSGLLKRTAAAVVSRVFTDRIIAISRAVKISLMDSGVPADMITIIYNGIDLSKFEGIEGTLRKELGVDPNVPIIGIVARLVPEKGYEYAINAFYHVLKQNPSALLVIVGDGPLEKSLKDMCVKMGIKDNVVFMGYRQGVENLVMDFDVFVLPSISEGLGLALLEAMALGKPAVATTAGGIPEIIKHDVNGLLVSPGNDKYLAESIIEVLSDKRRAKALGLAAQKTVNKKFSSKTMIEKTENVYREILQRV